MQLMSDEAQAMTREIREQTATHLQAILDNVKDAIITVDDAGLIESVNHTAERIFGYAPAEIHARSIGLLLPAVDTHNPCASLERLPTTTHPPHLAFPPTHP